jgi:hypothetical protein
VKICEILYQHQKERVEKLVDLPQGNTGDGHEIDLQMELKISTRMKLMWKFLNADDMFGNTALHMAVMYRRKEVVDWIMSTKEGKDSLNALNLDGFTPLTLSARHGFTDMFQHLLFTHMSKIAWEYGKVKKCAVIFAAFRECA